MPITRTSLADEIDLYLAYDPSTGVFTNKQQRRRAKVGSQVGTGSADGYIRITFRRKQYLAHRLAWLLMTGDWPVADIDHKDLNRSNNRWENLRPADQSQNSANSPKRRSNTSGFKGVSFNKSVGKYQASIFVRGRTIHLGYFQSAELGAQAYAAAAFDHFGEFGRSS